MNSFLLAVIADDAPHNTEPDFGKASPVGLVVIVLLPSVKSRREEAFVEA